MKILITVLFSLNLMAGISKYGDYYMESFKAHYINPAALSDMGNEIYAESKGEIGYKYDDLFIGATKKKFTLGYQVNDFVGVEAFISAKNGKGVESYGATLGVFNRGEYGFYTGFSDFKEGCLTPKVGFSAGAFSGILFGEYKGQYISPDDYSFLIGWAKIIENFHGDLTYGQTNSKKRSLLATIGGRTWVLKDLMGYAALSKEIYFKEDIKAKVGLELYATPRVLFGLTHDLTAFSMKHPKYSDFDVNLLVKYFL